MVLAGIAATLPESPFFAGLEFLGLGALVGAEVMAVRETEALWARKETADKLVGDLRVTIFEKAREKGLSFSERVKNLLLKPNINLSLL